MGRSSTSILSLGIAIALATPVVARAQEDPLATTPVAGIAVELAFTYVSHDSRTLAAWTEHSASIVIGSVFRPVPELETRVVLPLTYASTSLEGGRTGALVGNPFLGVGYVTTGAPFTAAVGGGIAAPLARARTTAEHVALALAAELRGMRDLWLWYTDAVAIVVDGRLRWARDPWDLRVGWALALLVDLVESTPTDMFTIPDLTVTRDRPDRAVTQLVAEGAIDVGAHVHPGLALALFAFAANGPIAPDGSRDDVQLSADALVAWRPDRAFVEARFTLNLDSPLGLGEPYGPIWGARVSGGADF